jgi:hypothetical protein
MVTNFELWLACFGLGGTASLELVGSYLAGTGDLSTW